MKTGPARGRRLSLAAYAMKSPLGAAYSRLRWGPLGKYIWHSRRVAGWTQGEEALALANASYSLTGDAVVVEIGTFMGSSAILLAGPRKLRAGGMVHCVDPFDGSGDPFSAPIYQAALRRSKRPLLEEFRHNIARAGVGDRVSVHVGRGEDVAREWTAPIDLLFLDGDHTYEGILATFHAWMPFLKPGGILAIHTSKPEAYEPGHDGPVRLVAAHIHPPGFEDIRLVTSTTFARKSA
jgi:hypothetical protein